MIHAVIEQIKRIHFLLRIQSPEADMISISEIISSELHQQQVEKKRIYERKCLQPFSNLHGLKGLSTTQKIFVEIMIQIGMEQTWLFRCNPFHYADCLPIFVTEIVIDFSE